jgi:hypothetical protein
MAEPHPHDDVVGYLVATANAHHAATGGVNAQWAHWYAEYLLDDLNGALQTEMDVGELEAWLIAADGRYREGPQTLSWPRAYAAWLREENEHKS